MEANARKLTVLCKDELEYSATTGKIHLQATSQGSKLFAIVSTMATMLTGETQLVESMNSIIRLIGNRCPSIDLATMSARLTIKKALSYSIDTSLASSKRWSTFVKQAGPLLQDMMTAGQEYLVVHTLTDRFVPPLPVSWVDLNGSLSNTDLRLALPDLKVSEQMAWASSYSGRIRSLTKDVSKEKKQVSLGAGLKVFVLSAEGTDKKIILLQAFTYRSQIVGVLLETNAEGHLVFKDGTLEFVSVADALKDFFSDEEGHKRDVLCKVWFAQAVTCPGGSFQCVKDNGQLFEAGDNFASLLRTHPLLDVNAARFRSQHVVNPNSSAKPLKSQSRSAETKRPSPPISDHGDIELTKQCLEDVGNLAAGYAFQDEMTDAQKEASNLDTELETQDISDSNRARIQKVIKTEAGKKCQDVSILEQAVDIVRETHSKSDVCLTRSELEEEALLLLIQEFEKQQQQQSSNTAEKPTKRKPGVDVSINRDKESAGSSGGSQSRVSVDVEVQEILTSSTEISAKQDQKIKYQCFQDNDVLVQVLMDESESRSAEAETQSDAIFSSSRFSRDKSFSSEKLEKKAPTIQKSVFDVWQEGVLKTLDSFVERNKLCGLPLGSNNDISALLSLPQDMDDTNLQQHDELFDYYDVVLVHWTNVEKRQGRVIRLDSHNRVIYSAPYLFGKQNPSLAFDESKFCDLAISIGAQNRKQRGNFGNLRDAVSEAMSHFLTFSKFACMIANNAA
eukprot:s278_g17.t1